MTRPDRHRGGRAQGVCVGAPRTGGAGGAQSIVSSALGCDSLRIVEITVALSERFPWLPGTLLFEHRAVSSIVQEIVRLSQPAARTAGAARERATEPGPVAPVGRHRRRRSRRSRRRRELGGRVVGAAPLGRQRRGARARRATALPASARRLTPALGRPHRRRRPLRSGVLRRVAARSGNHGSAAAAVPRGGVGRARGCRHRWRVARSVDGRLCRCDVWRLRVSRQRRVSRRRPAPIDAGKASAWPTGSRSSRLSRSEPRRRHGVLVVGHRAASGCNALKAGECHVAIAGGVNLILDPDRFASLGRLGILSSRGVCEPFGADADGTGAWRGRRRRRAAAACRCVACVGTASTASSRAPVSAPAAAPSGSPRPTRRPSPRRFAAVSRAARVDPAHDLLCRNARARARCSATPSKCAGLIGLHRSRADRPGDRRPAGLHDRLHQAERRSPRSRRWCGGSDQQAAAARAPACSAVADIGATEPCRFRSRRVHSTCSARPAYGRKPSSASTDARRPCRGAPV